MKKRILISLAALFVALGVSSQTQVNVKVAEGILAGTDSSGVKIFKGVPLRRSTSRQSPLARATAGGLLAGCKGCHKVWSQPDAGADFR